MLKNDWSEKQIDVDAKMLAKIIFNKETPNYLPLEHEKDTQVNELYAQLDSLLQKNQLNEAEDLLYEKVETQNFRYLELAIDFYVKLNHKTDEELDEADFDRSEIEEGLQDMIHRFNITLPA
ncbi:MULTISPECIES: DUF6483 family protein [Caproicibacterium]|uniref:DUF6483 family protein n=1 Tax=Caproicibacterium argilliputei TaxID=3030016 RepID=A0AA97DBF7_9FIRM|nr:DUF6483 family protein [Caproicibacterium argilliputei]WOC33177.1 DUF6483 family protein [Caproicibacterium argilliputei]